MKSALITGATGYIGSRLAIKLLSDGWQVNIITRPSSSNSLLGQYYHRVKNFIHEGSIEGMLQIMYSAKPDVIFHLASVAKSEHHFKDIEPIINSNLLFSTQLLEAMRQSGVKNFINTETFWQYRSNTSDYYPTNLYAATKQAFRDILIYYVGAANINAISLVLYDTYGPSDPRQKLIELLKRAAQDARQIDMTPGQQLVDMTHIDDVVAAYLRAGEMLLSENSGYLNTYAVSSGHRMTLRQLVELIVRETGISIHPIWGGKPYRRNEVMIPWVGKPLPGWQPKIDLATGIRDVFKGL